MYVKKIKIYIETKTTLEIKNSKKLYFCNVKDFIFNKYIRKMCKFYNDLQLIDR